MPNPGTYRDTDDPISSPKHTAVTKVKDDVQVFTEILDHDDSPGKASRQKYYRRILSLDGKGVTFVQLQKIGASGHRQNICGVGYLSVKLPCRLYNVQQDAKPAASNSRNSHISGAMVLVMHTQTKFAE